MSPDTKKKGGHFSGSGEGWPKTSTDRPSRPPPWCGEGVSSRHDPPPQERRHGCRDPDRLRRRARAAHPRPAREAPAGHAPGLRAGAAAGGEQAQGQGQVEEALSRRAAAGFSCTAGVPPIFVSRPAPVGAVDACPRGPGSGPHSVWHVYSVDLRQGCPAFAGGGRAAFDPSQFTRSGARYSDPNSDIERGYKPCLWTR